MIVRNAPMSLHVVFAVVGALQLGKRWNKSAADRCRQTSGGRTLDCDSRCLAVAADRSVSRLHRRCLAAEWPRRKICAVAVAVDTGRVRFI